MGSRRRPLYTTALLTLGLLVLTTVAATAEPHIDLTVVRGDTLRTLCRQLLENPNRCREIYRFNNLKNPDLILPGQKLLVPAGLLKGVPDDGIVTFVKGEVTRQQGAEQHAIMLNETLKEGERVVTGKDGVLEISYDDGTQVLLRNNSSLDLIRSKRKGDSYFLRDMLLSSGRILTKIRRATGREQRFNIKTPSAVSAARGTVFNVSLDRNDATRTETLEGTVSVTGDRREVLLHGGEGTVVQKGEQPLSPRKLLPPPSPLEFPELFRSAPLRISIPQVTGAVSYHLMLARDKEMKDLVREQVLPLKEPFVVDTLEDGHYFLQARSIDDMGIEGKPSPAVPLAFRANPLPPIINTPAHGSETRDKDVVFRWLKVRDAAAYHLQVATDDVFSRFVQDLPTLDGTEYEVEDLSPGNYFFRVASVAADRYQGEWSDRLSFTVIPPPPTPAVAPPEEEKGKMRLRVRDAGAGLTYRFQTARDSGFAEPLFDGTSERPEITIERPEEPGIYYVRSACIDGKGYQGSFSPPQSFEVKRRFPYGLMGIVGGVLGLILGLAL